MHVLHGVVFHWRASPLSCHVNGKSRYMCICVYIYVYVRQRLKGRACALSFLMDTWKNPPDELEENH